MLIGNAGRVFGEFLGKTSRFLANGNIIRNGGPYFTGGCRGTSGAVARERLRVLGGCHCLGVGCRERCVEIILVPM